MQVEMQNLSSQSGKGGEVGEELRMTMMMIDV